MRVLFQRVHAASVTVGGEVVGRIGPGGVILLGIARGDGDPEIRTLCRKVVRLRVFDDADGRMNLPLSAVEGGALLVVSQFTLYGDCRKGNRPSYLEAAPPEEARPVYEAFVQALRDAGCRVETGRFQQTMRLALENDGPVTLWMDTATLAAGG